MTFQDRSKESVQSLLALLRSTQDGDATPEPALSSKPITSSVPSKRQLDDLLSSLGSSSQSIIPSPYSNHAPSASPRSRQLIEPFGPVAQLAGPSRPSFDPQAQPPPTLPNDHISSRHSRTADQNAGADHDTLTFAKSLPILTDLLSDESVISELRKMKADQDALERRLWAKQERVKAEHERVVKAEKDIAKIAQRPISPDKEAQWAETLATNLEDFYRQTCLTSIDGLAVRQRQRLRELGVPGLGGGDVEKNLERVRRVMDLLEAGMEE